MKPLWEMLWEPISIPRWLFILLVIGILLNALVDLLRWVVE